MPIVNAKTVEQCCAMAALTRFTLLVQWENMSKVLLEVQLKTNQVNVRSMERISKWSVLNAIISRSVWCVIFLDHIKIMRLCWSRITLEMQKNHSPAFCQSWIKGCQPSRNLEKSSNRVLKRLSSNEDLPQPVSPTQRILKTKPSVIVLAMIWFGKLLMPQSSFNSNVRIDGPWETKSMWRREVDLEDIYLSFR